MNNDLSFQIANPVEPIAGSLEVNDSAVSKPLRLRDCYVLLFVSRGNVGIRSVGSHIRVEAGQTMLIDPEPSRRLTIEAESDTEHYLLWFRSPSRHDESGVDEVSRHLGIPVLASARRPERLTYLLRRYLHQQDRRGSSRLLRAGLLVLILCEVAMSNATETVDPPEENWPNTIVSRVDAYIAAHYREQIGTIDIAAELRYNPDYLERAYRQLTDLSIRDAIHLRRVNEAAAQLLLHGECSVSEIATMCGYHDVNYFRRVFKKAMRTTPNRYRHAGSAEDSGAARSNARVPA